MLNPLPVPEPVPQALFFLQPLEEGEVTRHHLAPQSSPRGSPRRTGLSAFYRWGNRGSERQEIRGGFGTRPVGRVLLLAAHWDHLVASTMC